MKATNQLETLWQQYLAPNVTWHNKKLPQNKCQRMEDALIFEFSHHQMESTSGKSIPSILNRKRKLTTSSQKTFMVNIYFRICVFKCGFQTIHIWANLAQYFFQSENQSFPKFCLSTLHNIQKLYKNCPLPEKVSYNKIITYMIHTQQLCFCMCLLQIKKYHWKSWYVKNP